MIDRSQQMIASGNQYEAGLIMSTLEDCLRATETGGVGTLARRSDSTVGLTSNYPTIKGQVIDIPISMVEFCVVARVKRSNDGDGEH